jgi:hypothetical protein
MRGALWRGGHDAAVPMCFLAPTSVGGSVSPLVLTTYFRTLHRAFVDLLSASLRKVGLLNQASDMVCNVLTSFVEEVVL